MLLSGENPDALRGIYLDLCVFDEYGMQNPRVWGEVVRPALSDREGRAIFLGTPSMDIIIFLKSCSKLKNQVQEGSDHWYWKIAKASETKLVKETELEAAK